MKLCMVGKELHKRVYKCLILCYNKRKQGGTYAKRIRTGLLDTQKEYAKSNRMKDKIIVLVIVLMFLEAIVGYCGFVWYESQFDYVTTEQETKDVDLSTEGDNANAEYNDVQGNQYKDNATHKCPTCGKFMGNGSHGQT